MVYDRFKIGVAIRVVILLSTVILLAWMLAHTSWYVSESLLVAATVAQTVFLVHFASRWSREAARFLQSVSFDDTSASFSGLSRDSMFRDLGEAMGQVMDRLRAGRAEREEQAQYLKVLINHVPVALVTVGEDGAVQMLNFAARRLFESVCAKAADFSRYGQAFAAGLEQLRPGDAAVVRMERRTGTLQLKAAVSEITIRRKRQRIISLQNVENELNAHELVAWQNVIRVMAHEVMNSLTPVTSLASTARDVVGNVLQRLPADDPNRAMLTDADEALETMKRRSEGLLHFVQNHRRLTKRLVANLGPVSIQRLFVRLERLLASELEARGIQLTVSVEPYSLELHGDAELIDQALINLVRNAIEALAGKPDGRIEMAAFRDSDGKTVIVVTDNGPGIPADQREKVFVPFFTTKRQGSGVGLTLARQIAAVHGGRIAISEEQGGGAKVSLTV